MKLEPLLFVLSVLALSPRTLAGVITGRVVDSLGSGVSGVNIRVEGSGGPTISNGGTGPGGFFTATITPDGVCDLFFEPPPPPATTHLVAVESGVLVAGTVNLGDVVLPPEVALSGRTVAAVGGAPVAGVNLDVLQGGTELPLVGALSNSSGLFSIAVPTGPIEVRFKTEGLPGPLLAPKVLDLSLSAGTSLGDVLLQPGLILSLIVKRQSNGSPVQNADIDVFDAATGNQLFTSSDSTDSAGFVDVVVAAGTYDVEICPQFSNKLVATTLFGKVVSGNTFLGTVFLAGGVVLSGNVQAFNGQKYAKVDLDLEFSSTGAEVTLCGDNTDANGNYAVAVPTGTFDVEFTPLYAHPLGTQFINGVVVSADKTLNGVLPSCPFYTNVGTGIPGSGGFTPQISASGGAPRLGNPSYTVDVTQGLGGVHVFLLAWLSRPGGPPFGGGRLILFPPPMPPPKLSGPAGGAGVGTYSRNFPVPHDPAFAGFTFHARAIVLDPAAANGKALTNELQATYCP